MSTYHGMVEKEVMFINEESLPLNQLLPSGNNGGGRTEGSASTDEIHPDVFLDDDYENTVTYLTVRGSSSSSSSPHRFLEDVDYWRKRAGWYDDDNKMSEYNKGVYDTYYSVEDDMAASSSSKSSNSAAIFGSGDMITSSIKVFAGIVGLAIFLLLVRALRRRSSSGKKKSTRRGGLGGSSGDPDHLTRTKSSKGRSSSRARPSSRARSKSGERLKRSRSRSRARRHREDGGGGDAKDYNLMEEGERDTKSSTRSKSRDKKRSSRSRSRARRESSSRKESMLV